MVKIINFIFFEKYFELGDSMSDAEFGRTLKAVGKYLRYGNEEDAGNLTDKEQMLYSVMKLEIAHGHKKYAEVCEKNNNKYKNNKKNNYNKTEEHYDFDEIEHLALQRRLAGNHN